MARSHSTNRLRSTIVFRELRHINTAGPATCPSGARMLRNVLSRMIQPDPASTSTPFVYQLRARSVYSNSEHSTIPSSA